MAAKANTVMSTGAVSSSSGGEGPVEFDPRDDRGPNTRLIRLARIGAGLALIAALIWYLFIFDT